MKIDLVLIERLEVYVDRGLFASIFPDGILVQGPPDEEIIKKVLRVELETDGLCDVVLTDGALRDYNTEVEKAWNDCFERLAPTGIGFYPVIAAAAWRFLSNPSNLKPEYRS